MVNLSSSRVSVTFLRFKAIIFLFLLLFSLKSLALVATEVPLLLFQIQAQRNIGKPYCSMCHINLYKTNLDIRKLSHLVSPNNQQNFRKIFSIIGISILKSSMIHHFNQNIFLKYKGEKVKCFRDETRFCLILTCLESWHQQQRPKSIYNVL